MKYPPPLKRFFWAVQRFPVCFAVEHVKAWDWQAPACVLPVPPTFFELFLLMPLSFAGVIAANPFPYLGPRFAFPPFFDLFLVLGELLYMG